MFAPPGTSRAFPVTFVSPVVDHRVCTPLCSCSACSPPCSCLCGVRYPPVILRDPLGGGTRRRSCNTTSKSACPSSSTTSPRVSVCVCFFVSMSVRMVVYHVCVCARGLCHPACARACICACCFCVCLLRARACARVTLCVRSCFLSLRQGTRRRRLGDTSSPTSRCVPVLILAAHVRQCPLSRLLSGHAVQLHSVWRVRAVP